MPIIYSLYKSFTKMLTTDNKQFTISQGLYGIILMEINKRKLHHFSSVKRLHFIAKHKKKR